ncbi:MAG: hypothetical protein ACRDSZ_07175 [Pseudonocardiaceae bacterium]
MRKKIYITALMAGLALPLAFAAPAQAQVQYVYHGDLGRAWTNTEHTRVGVEDLKRNGNGVYALYKIRGSQNQYHVGDRNGSFPGHGAEDAGGIVQKIKVCVRDVGCTGWKTVT